MPFRLLDVDIEADFDKVIACEWASFENPLQPFFRMFCPLIGKGPSARADSIKASTDRQMEWYKSDPTSYWQKVVDDEGTIVGAALWKIHPTNPFEKPEEHGHADWQPAGEQREYFAKCLEQFDAPRKRMAARPQVFLNIMYTHPDFRRQGVADLFLSWGEQKADELGAEMWLDATSYGVPAYQKHGFVVVHENRIRPTKENPDETWTEVDREVQPMVFWQMWRPVGGQYEEGKTVKPWADE